MGEAEKSGARDARVSRFSFYLSEDLDDEAIDRVQAAFSRIRNLIISGEMAPGSPITESKLAEKLGLSRTPVRTALYRLREAGYVHASRARKYTQLIVAPLTAADMRELFRIMGSLEGLAAAEAASLAPDQRDGIASAIEELNDQLYAAAASAPPDMAHAQDLHVRLHRIHIEAAAGPRLRSQIDSVHSLAERYERFYTQALVAELPMSVREHKGIATAIFAGDAEVAERRVAANWRNGAVRFDRILRSLGVRDGSPLEGGAVAKVVQDGRPRSK